MNKLRLNLLANFNYPNYFEGQYRTNKPGIKVCIIGSALLVIYRMFIEFTILDLIFLIMLLLFTLICDKLSRRWFQNTYFIYSVLIFALRLRNGIVQSENSVDSTLYFMRGFFYGYMSPFLIYTQPQISHSLILGIVLIIIKIILFDSSYVIPFYANIFMDILVMSSNLFTEISRRKNFLQLEEKNQFLQKFKDIIEKHLSSGMVILNLNSTKVLFANKFVRSIFDCYNDDLLLESIKKLNISDSPNRTNLTSEPENLYTERQNINEPANVHESEQFSFNYFCSKQEKILSLEAYSFPIQWEGEQSKGIFFNDVTHQIEITELKISNQNKEMAISTVAHELRNPLSGILGIVELLEELDMPSLAKKRITTVKTVMKYLLNLLNTLLDLQQLKNNKLKLNYSSFPLKDLLDEIKNIFEFQCIEKGIHFDIELENIDKNFTIISDKDRIAQILINLCANAIKFTLSGGIQICVKYDQLSTLLQFKVSDTGVGISKHDIEKLFKAFGKIESTTSMNKHGVGLGLMISNSLVMILNSNSEYKNINVESTQGVGTCFSFNLDISYMRNEVETYLEIRESDQSKCINSPRESVYYPSFLHQNCSIMSPRGPEENLLTRNLIIIVDDNPFNTIALKHSIEKYGYDCLTALNGKEAIELITKKSESIFKVFMDLEMPVMDGLEATQKITRLMKEGKITRFEIIGLSGHDDEVIKKSCLECGMQGYITRPFNLKDLGKFLDRN